MNISRNASGPRGPRGSRARRTAVAVCAAVALPVSLGVLAPQASAAPAASDPFGPACASLPQSGAGSAASMASKPVATAAAENPELSTLTAALERAGLIDTLNNAKNLTVFAPTNAAFEKIPKADLDALLANKAELTKVLTYHVVGEKISKSQLANGTFTTMEGSTLSTSGSGSAFKVNDAANIVCGDVTTSNATVNLIDTVLMPK
ncbi:fasciclin domain-containing protein [Streptomyces sp. NBC_01498]|uniref:fasciclin domain-containing protein n=1 Tax=Streptomyces sp. NBC_01498 TaxID=2975870 RepID=UPI002E7BF7E8|nr:fasciclin domain-containing protein [Streptomyces sp. NBC_01498]WTL23310.1 fasciclin domain-containing protein [Streptomyces sp. NBC_01498]